MDEQITTLEYLLMDFEAIGLDMDDTDYEDNSSKWRAVNNDMGRYYDVWVEANAVNDDIIDDIDDNYDSYEESFKSYLDENDIEYIDVEILTEDDRGEVIFSVTIEII